jgi:hypothetical protein
VGAKPASILRGPDWSLTRATITAYLKPEEQLVMLFTAVTPAPEFGVHLIDGAVAPLAWAVWRAMWRHEVRVGTRAAGVPLAPRMIVALTADRVVIWRATPKWRLGQVCGELPRERILRVSEVGGGSRSRRLVLQTSTGSTFCLMVTPDAAGRLTEMFS